MKRISLFIFFLTLSLVLIVFGIKLITANDLEKVNSFRIYYRDIDERILNEMSGYDLVIVEALHFTKNDVELVTSNNKTLIFGYLSLMEIGNWDEKIIDSLNSSDYLYIKGKKVVSNENYLGNIANEHYQDVLIDTVKERITAKGMDGVFFDTIGIIDQYSNDPEIYNLLFSGYENFLKKFKKELPKTYIIQNRGFNILSMSSKYLDGFLWENFRAQDIDLSKSVLTRIENLKLISKRENLVIFTESYNFPGENITYTQKLGWIHFQNNSDQHSNWDMMNNDN